MIHSRNSHVVADASVVVALIGYDGPAHDWAERQLTSKGVFAPDLMPFEAANALRSRWLARTIDDSAVTIALTRLRALPAVLSPGMLLLHRAWELRHNLTIYDASYVALAELLDVPLVTLDVRIVGAPGVRCEVRAYGG
jgi:predicted nucleic acid-binding protein